jgi:hypothetical protein
MSRSYKKNPAGSGRVSEKEDKRILNRSMRRSSKQLIDKHAETDEDLILPVKDEVLNRWRMAKDGCGWWGSFEEWKQILGWEPYSTIRGWRCGNADSTYWDYYKVYLMK